MRKLERLRETPSGPVTPEYFAEKARQGWTLSMIEWSRPANGEAGQGEEPPYGTQIGSDCAHLEDNPAEMRTLSLILEKIVQDLPLSRIADELNLAGLATRAGTRWTQPAVFVLLPRLVDVGPRILGHAGWPARRHLPGI